VLGVVHAVATDPATVWMPALGHETSRGSEIAETTTILLGRVLRLIARRQPRAAGAQLALRRHQRAAAARHQQCRQARPARPRAAEAGCKPATWAHSSCCYPERISMEVPRAADEPT
jgi:hypothetical protein